MHPDFDKDDVPVWLALNLNFGCLRCQKAVSGR